MDLSEPFILQGVGWYFVLELWQFPGGHEGAIGCFKFLLGLVWGAFAVYL